MNQRHDRSSHDAEAHDHHDLEGPQPGDPVSAGAPVRGAGEPDPDELAAELKFLREEVDLLRRRLETAPARIRTLEERLLETKGKLQGALAQNDKLTETLRAARDQLAQMREEVERLAAPPQSYATFLAHDPDTGTATVVVSGRKLEVGLGPEIEFDELRAGQEVLLNESMNVVAVGAFESRGELMVIAELLDDGRAVVLGHTDDERVIHLADPLRELPLKAGDSLLVDT
ncbi:MAG TPA: hypothetical protein VK906_11915, partial [Egicoccus sp.]